MSRDASGAVLADGHVKVVHGQQTVTADQMRYDAKGHSMEAQGHVVITDPRGRMEAAHAVLDTQSHTGEIQGVKARLNTGETMTAERVQRLDGLHSVVHRATLTQCPDDALAWRIRARKAELDQQEGVFRVEDAYFEVAQVPVLYTPYWQYSLRRRSGLLMPYVASGKLRGTEIALPVYYAPADNWDMTLTPHWMSARGLQGNVEWRHVSGTGHEQLQFDGLRDKVTSKQRWRVRSTMNRHLPADIQLSLQADHIGDHYYLADFSRDASQVSTRYLQSAASLAQKGDWWDWTLAAQHQQNLLATNDATTLQTLPRFSSRLFLPLGESGSRVYLDQQSTRFARGVGVDGTRVFVTPHLEVPWQMSGGGLRSHLSLGYYQLQYWLQGIGPASSTPGVHGGYASLETRLDFERISESQQWRHTISPIVRYDVSSAGNQQNLPVFDAAVMPLTLSSLMQGNRYSGNDRFERMNRFSLMLESALQHKSGGSGVVSRELLRARFGVAFDMNRYAVDPALSAVQNRSWSNLLGEVQFSPWKTLSMSFGGQFDPVANYWAKNDAALQYEGERVEFSGNWQRTDARYAQASELIGGHASLRFMQRWRGLGDAQFDARLSSMQSVSWGLQYIHPCWDAKLEHFQVRRVGTATSGDKGFRFLLGFKGLGSVGS